jgi:uncharacterized protein
LYTPEDSPLIPSTTDGVTIGAPATRPVAPVWHTALLIAAILLLSFAGAKQFSGEHAAHVNRLQTYGFTIATELVMLAWVYIGLRLRRIPFRAIFGDVSGGSRSLGIDLGSAAVFWIGSLVVLGTINAMWTISDAVIHHRPLFPNGKPDPAQEHTLHTLAGLAPGNASEIAAWILLCVMAGFTEEIVFRGYLQRQFTAWGRGAVAVGVVFSALLFGVAHGYQGVHYMVLLSIFGALFSLLAIFRRNIRAGIFAHAWQDIIAGLALALLHSRHVI